MLSDTKQRILEYIQKNENVTPHQLLIEFGLSRVMLHRHLKALVDSKQIKKQGSAPRVYYIVSQENKALPEVNFSVEENRIIETNFLNFQPDGSILRGVNGFKKWCIKRKLSIQKTAQDYFKIYIKYQKYHNKNGFIEGTAKMQKTFDEVFLDKTYYLDFYAVERFGKTKLGSLLLYAKQTQNLKLMQEIAKIIKNPLHRLIQTEKIDTIAFIPHSLKREKQLLPQLRQMLNLGLPEIKLFKLQTEVTIAQKTLSSLDERIENASKTIFVESRHLPKTQNLLLFDDAVGSGSTLNEVARKIRQQKICSGKIIGFAVVGSLKGFEVLTEV